MSTEYDAELERRIAEDQGMERERSAAQRRHRFAEVETLAKRLSIEIRTAWESSTSTAPAWAFYAAEEFLAERDRRKAAL